MNLPAHWKISVMDCTVSRCSSAMRSAASALVMPIRWVRATGHFGAGRSCERERKLVRRTHGIEGKRLAARRVGFVLKYVALANITIAQAQPSSLACEKASPQLDAVLAAEPPGTITTLLGALSACFRSHIICGVVYDHTQLYAHVFSGEKTTDVPSVQYYEGGASYALMASRSFPPSHKSRLEYCLALTSGGEQSAGTFSWHGWTIAPGGEVRTLDLSDVSTTAIHTNPRSMAAALWNLYAAKF